MLRFSQPRWQSSKRLILLACTLYTELPFGSRGNEFRAAQVLDREDDTLVWGSL